MPAEIRPMTIGDYCDVFVLAGHDAGREFWRHNGWYDWPDIRLMSRDWEGEFPGA
jgi:hypothetical protein